MTLARLGVCFCIRQAPYLLPHRALSSRSGPSTRPSWPLGSFSCRSCVAAEHVAPSVTGRNGPLASELENSEDALWSSHAIQNRKPSSRLSLPGSSRPFLLYPTMLNRWLSAVNERVRSGVPAARRWAEGRSERTTGRLWRTNGRICWRRIGGAPVGPGRAARVPPSRLRAGGGGGG